LAVSLLGIAIGAFYYSIERIVTTAPFFPNGMIQGINDILFIVIILEILRTVISRFTDGVYQLDKFLIIGVIAAVRHILTVGASLTLQTGKSDTAFERAVIELRAKRFDCYCPCLCHLYVKVRSPQPIIRMVNR
jgi:uncharacterized membrane protein (DUF373 family)